MKVKNHFVKYFIAIMSVIVLFTCIWGIPLKEAGISVKADGEAVCGTFTGTWNPVRGKEGVFIAEDGWIFEGIINPDGGLWNGTLTNYPVSAEDRASSVFELPEFYTGAVEESVLVDIELT